MTFIHWPEVIDSELLWTLIIVDYFLIIVILTMFWLLLNFLKEREYLHSWVIGIHYKHHKLYYKERGQLQEKTAKFWYSWLLVNCWPLTRFRLLNFPRPILQIFDQRFIIIHWKTQDFMIMLHVAFQQVFYPSRFHFHGFSSCIHCCP